MADKTIDLLPLLKKIAAENNFQSCDIKVTPISTGGANYSSLLYLANISRDGHDDLRLFVKAAVLGEKMREQCNVDPYDNECFIYTDLMTTFRKLEDKHGVSQEHRLRFPKYYGADLTYLNEVLVLEDLSSQGFLLQDRLTPVDWQYAAAAVTQLAQFHALSFAYEHENQKEFNEIIPRFQNKLFRENADTQKFFTGAVKTALNAVREEHRDLLKSFLDRYNMTEYGNLYDTNRRPVLIHGDFRPSNMLHKYRKDGTVELIPVDYQTLQYGSPIIDLLYFIFTATDGSTRAQFYNSLVQYYHSQLGAALHRLGLNVEDVYSEKEFHFELEEKLPFGLLFSSLFLPILLVAEEDAPKLDSELNMASMGNMATGELYRKRLNEVVDDYIAWGVLV